MCEYCHLNGKRLVDIYDYTLETAFIGREREKWVFICTANACEYGEDVYEIHYCPMCGRELGKDINVPAKGGEV
jgi:rRNA maturation endonuclease Nob1